MSSIYDDLFKQQVHVSGLNPSTTSKSPARISRRRQEGIGTLTEIVREALESAEGVSVVDDTGDDGQILGWVDDGERGGLVAFTFSLDSSERIDRMAEEVMDDIDHEEGLRNRVFGS